MIHADGHNSGGLFSIGHSNHALEDFLALLKQHGIQVLVDVRSAPYSRYASQFDREALERALKDAGLSYLFLGRELGGRPEGEEFYDTEGHVLYSQVAEAAFFEEGLERLKQGRARHRVAMMCSEEDPAVCHRYLLISRVLAERGIAVGHIRGDGRLESEADVAAANPEAQQPLLFAELEDAAWRSPRPIRKMDQPPDS
jgi:uncharacterized protein (DUF488 family)